MLALHEAIPSPGVLLTGQPLLIGTLGGTSLARPPCHVRPLHDLSDMDVRRTPYLAWSLEDTSVCYGRVTWKSFFGTLICH